jgi:hypothetical protein
VYYRGQETIEEGDTEAYVELPAYVQDVAHNFTVQLTQINSDRFESFARLRAGKVEAEGFAVYGDPCTFAWQVSGTRRQLEVEPLRAEVVVKGDGPYRYLE